MGQFNSSGKHNKNEWFPNYIATERYRDNVAISFCRDIVCIPNDFATNFMKYLNVEKV